MEKVKKFSTLSSKIKKLIFFAAIVYTIFVLVNQQITLSKINNEIENYSNKIEAISNENDGFKENIHRLHDLEYIESIARRQLGLIRENEKVYIFSKQ